MFRTVILQLMCILKDTGNSGDGALRRKWASRGSGRRVSDCILCSSVQLGFTPCVLRQMESLYFLAIVLHNTVFCATCNFTCGSFSLQHRTGSQEGCTLNDYQGTETILLCAGHPRGETEFLKLKMGSFWVLVRKSEHGMVCGRCCCVLHMIRGLLGNQSQEQHCPRDLGHLFGLGISI